MAEVPLSRRHRGLTKIRWSIDKKAIRWPKCLKDSINNFALWWEATKRVEAVVGEFGAFRGSRPARVPFSTIPFRHHLLSLPPEPDCRSDQAASRCDRQSASADLAIVVAIIIGAV